MNRKEAIRVMLEGKQVIDNAGNVVIFVDRSFRRNRLIGYRAI